MGNKTPKLRAVALREIKLSSPNKAQATRAVAALSELGHSIGSDLHQQPDLLHIEAVLVTEGINDNDDAFTRAGLKAALTSPILKPINWQHKDDQILGAMYSVEARNLDGDVVESIDGEPVELIVQGVVWHHLPHIKATAEQIVSRIEKGDLFVSMECWFDNYEYGLYTQAGELYDIIPRNNDTAFLEGYLRANGGVGRYNGMRIGRALSGVNFGGVAFVDRPANKRSFILNQFAFDPDSVMEIVDASSGDESPSLVIDNNVVSEKSPLMEVNMNDLNRTAASQDQIQDAVTKALAAQKDAEKAEMVKADLESKTVRASELESALDAAKAQLATLKTAIDHAFESAKAGATSNTPEEIARIDRALEAKGNGAGDAVYAAKIAWIEDSRSKAQVSLNESENASASEKLVEENALLKRELASLKSDIRKAEITHLFATVLEMTEDEVKTFVEAGVAIEDDAAYTVWMDEKKLFAKKMFEMKKDKKKDKKADDAEAGLLAPTERETSIEMYGATLRSDHGSAPSDVSRTPRSKLTAAADLDEMFEEVDAPNLAGASAIESTGKAPMGKLVAGLLSTPANKNQDN